MSQNSGELKRGEQSQIIVTGKHSYGIDNIRIASWNEGANLYIGSFNSIAINQLVFLGGNHRIDWMTTFPFGHIFHEAFPNGSIKGGGHPATKGHVVIENDVWIGEGCTLMSGITIGSGSVIATQSVVTKDVPPYAIVGGNPAKFIRYRFDEEVRTALLELAWWKYDDATINTIVPLLQEAPSLEIIEQIKQEIRVRETA